LISYLTKFPTADRSEGTIEEFWPLEEGPRSLMRNEAPPPTTGVDENILAHLPLVIVDAYWDPRSQRPSGHRIRQQNVHLNRPENRTRRDREHPRIVPQNRQRSASNNHVTCVASIGSSRSRNINPFPAFDAIQDVTIGMFVGIETGKEDQSKGIPYFLGKVIDMERQAAEDGTFTILWYEP
jgi:hypothetical protein